MPARVLDVTALCAAFLTPVGHASVVLTLDTYSHVLPNMQQGAVSKLEAALFG